MAASSGGLSESDVSRVTDLISAANRMRFALEYLGIDRNEYTTIETEANFFHHDTVFECIRRWKNKTEAAGNHTRDTLTRILNQIRLDHGWFSFDKMVFLTDVSGIQIPQSSKKLNNIYVSYVSQLNESAIIIPISRKMKTTDPISCFIFPL